MKKRAASVAERTYPLWMLGRWDEVVRTEGGTDKEMLDAGGVVISLLQSAVDIYIQRGQLDEARRVYPASSTALRAHQFLRIPVTLASFA